MAIITVGVLALQGAFLEHLVLLRKAGAQIGSSSSSTAEVGSSNGTATFNGAAGGPLRKFEFLEVRTPEQLSRCDALVIPGGESTTLAFVAIQTGLMEPLRNFVKIDRKPVWGTCAGLIFLAEETTGAKKGGQEVVGGLHVRVHRNHFGRQVHSFQAKLDLPFLAELELDDDHSSSSPSTTTPSRPFPGVFIRAPVVEKILPEDKKTTTSTTSDSSVQVLGTVKRGDASDIIAVRQDNIFGTSFHPELTSDVRIHLWWLTQVVKATEEARG